ncbi:MAG: hypothetical protein ACKO2K_03940, partial [Alphaproteobacteria bacterium]
MKSTAPPPRRGAPWLLLVAALLVQGCGLASALHLPSFRMPSIFGRSSSKQVPADGSGAAGDAILLSRGSGVGKRDPIYVYLQLAMLSDRIVSSIVRETEAPLEETTDLNRRESILHLRLDLATALWNAASGPNPYANAIDFYVTIDLARRLLNGPSLSAALGDRRDDVDRVLAAASADTRALVRDFLSPAEFEALESAVASADASKLDSSTLDTIDLEKLLSSAQKRSSGKNSGLPSLLGILGVDPLASLDPATREIAETRQFGERMLFSVQRLPYLMRMNAELLANDVAQELDVDKAVDAIDRASEAMAQIGRTVEGLPDRISIERQKLVADLGSQSDRLGGLAREWRGAFEAASNTAGANDVALKTFDGVVQRMDWPPGSPPSSGDSVDVKEIGKTAAGVGDAAANLTTLLARLQQTLETPALERVPALANSVVGEAEATARRLLWTAFGLGCLLVAIASVAAILTSRL